MSLFETNLGDLPNNSRDLILKPKYDNETESFVMDVELNQNYLNNLNDNFVGFNNQISHWQNNFFIQLEKDQSFTLCPGPNIDYLLFNQGLNTINPTQLDLYTLQWIFSTAMGIYILHSNDVDFFGLDDQAVYIDTEFNARLSNFPYGTNKLSSTAPNYIYFSSPEQWSENDNKIIQLDKRQKKMSDIYSFGIFVHELVTRRKHSNEYFPKSMVKSDCVKKIKMGALEYMKLDETTDMPFLDLLYKCLDKDPKKRFTIDEIILYLLNVKHTTTSIYANNESYFNINNVDLEKYHQYIINIFGFKQEKTYRACKREIYNMMYNSFTLDTKPKDYHCTFDDLKEGYLKGLKYCITILDQYIEQLSYEQKQEYKDFINKNPQVNEFDVMKNYLKYQDDPETLKNELENLKYSSTDENDKNRLIEENRSIDEKSVFMTYYNTKYDAFITKIELSASTDHKFLADFLRKVDEMNQWEKNFFVTPCHLYTNQSITFCPTNVHSLLFTNNPIDIDKNQLNLYILQWLFSIAMGIFILNEKGIDYIGLTDKFLFVDTQMKIRLFQLEYGLDENFTTIPYRVYFYSPELFKYTILDKDKNQRIELSPDLKKKSDVYTFGLIAYELLTRDYHYQHLRNMPKHLLGEKIMKGAFNYLKLEQKKDSLPLYNLLCNCLKTKTEERWTIDKAINELLDIQSKNISDMIIRSDSEKKSNSLLSNEDLNKYHQFIISSVDLDKSTSFEDAKLFINNYMNGKLKFTVLKGKEPNCTMKQLEIGSKLGITHCDEIIDMMKKELQMDIRERYIYLTEKNSDLNKFDLMKIFFDYQEDEQKLDEKLNELLRNRYKKGRFICPLFNMDNDNSIFKKYVSPDYIEIPYNIQTEHFSHIIQPWLPDKNRIKNNKYISLFNFLYGDQQSYSISMVNLLTKMNWLLSVAEGIEEIHKKKCCLVSFSSKTVYIDEKLNAILFAPKTIQRYSTDNKLLAEELKESFLSRDAKIDEISIFYRPPELFNENIDKIDHIKCDIYSFGVFAKELIESNLPWLATQNLSKKEKLKVIQHPHWRDFLKPLFEIEESNELNNLIEVLNNSLKVDPEKRGDIKNIRICISNLISNYNRTFIPFTKKSFRSYKFSEIENKTPQSINIKYTVDKSYARTQLDDINSRTDRCKSKVVTMNLTLGSMSISGMRQIVLREVLNTDYNVELSYLINNSLFGIPKAKQLSMKSIFDALNDLKTNSFLNQPIGTNKKGDAVMKLSHFDA